MNLVEHLVEVLLKQEDDFLKVRETLTRIGVASKKTNTLFQSCHILHKQGRYYIVHFKELFDLDGKPTDFTTEDKQRRNTITNLLSDWGLVEVVNSDVTKDTIPVSRLKIIPFNQKDQWELVAKYNIGKKR
jgi:hypothetical protein